MMALPWKSRRAVEKSAPDIAAKERELALLRMQRQAVQRALNDLLKTTTKEPRDAGHD